MRSLGYKQKCKLAPFNLAHPVQWNTSERHTTYDEELQYEFAILQ